MEPAESLRNAYAPLILSLAKDQTPTFTEISDCGDPAALVFFPSR